MIKLNKNICKRCMNDYAVKKEIKESDGELLLWDKQNDFVWDLGKVFCKIYDNDVKFEDIEMSKCPYVLEHTVMGRNK